MSGHSKWHNIGGKVKEYGLYDIKDNEQCVYLGTLKEISNYLNCNYDGLRSYLTRKRQGKQHLFQHRYEIIEIYEEDKKLLEYQKKNKKCFGIR